MVKINMWDFRIVVFVEGERHGIDMINLCDVLVEDNNNSSNNNNNKHTNNKYDNKHNNKSNRDIKLFVILDD